jgi:hypothetical protein
MRGQQRFEQLSQRWMLPIQHPDALSYYPALAVYDVSRGNHRDLVDRFRL